MQSKKDIKSTGRRAFIRIVLYSGAGAMEVQSQLSCSGSNSMQNNLLINGEVLKKSKWNVETYLAAVPECMKENRAKLPLRSCKFNKKTKQRRIATQTITGVDERLRLVATIIDPEAHFADSTNSIEAKTNHAIIDKAFPDESLNPWLYIDKEDSFNFLQEDQIKIVLSEEAFSRILKHKP